MFQNIRYLLSLSIMGAFLFTCSPSKSTKSKLGSKSSQKIFKFGNGSEPTDLDPHVVTGVPEHHIISALFEGLVAPHPKTLKPKPAAAESWTISDDLMVYTFKINPQAKWSNGDAVTAHDFEFSWKRILTPTLASEYAYMLYPVKGAEAYNKNKTQDFSTVLAKAVDAQTFKVTLKAPTPYFLSMLFHYSSWPVHPKTIAKFGAEKKRGTQWTRPANIVTNGPFTLKTWELNKVLTVVKNPNYWNASIVKLDGVNFYPVDDNGAEERMFRNGELHVTSTLPVHKIPFYQKKKDPRLNISPYLGTYYYRFNVKKAPLNNPKVREALNLSIDRSLITKHVTKAGEMPSFTFTPPNTAGYTSRYQISKNNLEKAKALLAEAGFKDGVNFPKLTLLYNTQDNHKKIAEAIQQMWKKNLGIDIELNNQEWKVYLSSVKKGDFDIARAGWIGDYSDPNTFLDMFVTDGGNNQTGWSNKDYDSLIAKAAMTQSTSDRLALFNNAEEILLTELPIMPIYTYTSKYLKSESVVGWESNILDVHPFQHIDLK